MQPIFYVLKDVDGDYLTETGYTPWIGLARRFEDSAAIVMFAESSTNPFLRGSRIVQVQNISEPVYKEIQSF